MNSSYQLVLLPGLGADRRLLEPQQAAFPQLLVPPWISPLKRESLPDYAARMAETITPTPGCPLILGGVSLGGMLAYEMTKHLNPKATLLIASCRTRRGLRGVYRVGCWLLPVLPVRTWNIAKLLSGPVVQMRGGVPRQQKELAVRMFKAADSAFMHWALQAILNWTPSPSPKSPVFHIHGGRDVVIPSRRVEADCVISDGGHMINITHAEQVNEFIRQKVAAPENAC
jgi:pimeloyl-ACP methyl ester carboxylesterase